MTARALVVGDGIDAVLLALFAARRGSTVILCPKPRALPLAPPTYELCRPPASLVLSGRFALEHEIERMASEEAHPYRTLYPDGRGGIDAVALLQGSRDAASDLKAALEKVDLLLEGEVHAPRLALTEIGTLATAGLHPSGLAIYKRAELPKEADVLPGDASFDAELVAASLSTLVPSLDARPSTMPGDGRAVLVAPRFRDPPGAIVRELCPCRSPSGPSLRLALALERALAAAGVEIVDASPLSLEIAEDGVTLIAERDGAEIRIEAPCATIATGKFAGGGISSSPFLRSILLDAPVHCGARVETRIDGDRHFGRSVLDPHGAFRMGIAIDQWQRPLSASGTPISGRLHAAGGVIGGLDEIREGSGFSLISAFRCAGLLEGP